MRLRPIALACLVLFILILVSHAYAFLNQNMMLAGKARAPTLPVNVTAVGLSNSNFTTGTAGTVGTLSATLSGGSPTGTFSLTNSGTDHSGTTCNNYSADFSVSGTNLNFTSGAPAQSYPGTCVTYTQAGVSNSPYTQAFALMGNSGGGGGGPAVPAGAAAAGFNTVALNLDWTGATTSSFAGRTYNINDLTSSASWLSCQYAQGGGNAPSNPVMFVTGGPNSAVPCSDISIVNDGGTNALHNVWTLTDQSNGRNVTSITSIPVNEVSSLGQLFPEGGIYVEWIGRTTTASQGSCAQPCGAQIWDVWSWPYSSSGSNIGVGLEWDFLESAANTFGYSAVHGWGGESAQCCTPPAWGYIGYTSYHKFGIRITSDGTNEDECGYLDGAFIGCGGEFAPGLGSTTANQRGDIRIDTGDFGGYTAIAGTEIFMQRFTLFSCSSWQTTPCNTTVLTGSP